MNLILRKLLYSAVETGLAWSKTTSSPVDDLLFTVLKEVLDYVYSKDDPKPEDIQEALLKAASTLEV